MSGFITHPVGEDFPTVVVTANDYVALPDIGTDGSVRSIQVLSMRAQGLVGIEGPPLLRPVVGNAPLADPRWEHIAHWVPRFRWSSGSLDIIETILAPVGHKGFVIVLQVENRGDPTSVPLGLAGTWERTSYTLFKSRPLPVTVSRRPDPWTKSLGMEASAGLPVIAWAIHAEPDAESPGAETSTGALAFRVTRDYRLHTRERAEIAFYIGVGAEEDGARTTAVDLRRRGWKALLAETTAWLQSRLASQSGRLADLFNRNLLFNRFFACGRTIDTEEPVWVTSRSPRYYVSAAFWSRDAFLWSLPGLLLADRQAARESIAYALRTQWRNAGMHAQYLNGGVIYPGFELDELAAFPVGLAAYLRATDDATILDEEGVMTAALQYPQRLAAHRDACGLYATFLDPSDDPVEHPFLTYDNVLAWRGLCDVASIYQRVGWEEDAGASLRTAKELEQAIWRHCVAANPRGQMFAWAVDGAGTAQLYDDPPGSLLLLPHYGFCAPDHPAYVNTAAWVRSPDNPWYVGGPFAAPASAHSPDPWPMAIVNDLLLGRTEALDWLRRVEMDGGIACETVDAQTGRVKTGGAFATFAGLLASALFRHRDQWTS